MTNSATPPPKKRRFGKVLNWLSEIILALVLLILFAIFPKALGWVGDIVNSLGISWLQMEPSSGRALDITAYVHTFLSKAGQLVAANLLIWVLFVCFYPTIANYIRYDDGDTSRPRFREDWDKLTPTVRILLFTGYLAFQLVYLALL